MARFTIQYIIATIQIATVAVAWASFYSDRHPLRLGCAIFCSILYIHVYFSPYGKNK